MIRLGLFIVALSAGAPAAVTVTYLASEGVMVTGGKTKVLIDALFRDARPEYTRHPANVQLQIEAGRAPFDGVTLALATHNHGDHTDAGTVTRFLEANPAARFASTPQTTETLPAALRPRVQTLWPTGDRRAALDAPGLKVEAMALDHGPTMQNLAYRLSLEGQVLMHLGDADPSAANFSRLATVQPPDVLMAPFWWLMNAESIAFLKERWKPKAIIAIHFGPGDLVRAPAIAEKLPNVWSATKQGESRRY